jgi:glyoxylase-like metal-dependent hydrolase (beta-lactamase superfamily II)
VTVSTDGQRLQLGTSIFEVLHTPGHALHHHVLHDLDARAVFTGDTFGLSYRSTDTARGAFAVPTTTPTQFDPDQLVMSIRRIAELEPAACFLTHFGRVTAVARLARSLETQVTRFAEIAQARSGTAEPEQWIRADVAELWGRLLAEHGLEASPAGIEELLGEDLTLNAQGLVSWLERRARTG